MTPEDFNYFQTRVTRFISGSNSGIKFGSSVTPRYTKLSNIIPRRALPQQVLERIQRKTTSDIDDNIESSPRGVSALGRVTLNLEQTKNNLEKIFQIIADDYKTSKEQNKKEIDDYRKRVANRGRIFGKKELGDKKSDILGTVKKYVGSFFSGTGGAIRSLAMFNLLQGLLSGDPSKIIGPLLGIGLTYVPAIAGMIVSGVAGGLATKLFSRGGGAVAQAAEGAAPMAAKIPKFKKFGKNAALAGLFATMAAAMAKPQDESQQRLQQLTEQQKESVDPQSLGPIPENELKRFDNLNKKFEEALNFLLKNQKGGTLQGASGSDSGGGGGGGTPTPQDVTSTGQTIDIGGGISYYGPGFAGNPTANGETFDPNALTAAHPSLPFGTLLRVTNKDNGQSVVVRVNDRGPFHDNRSLDLSEGAMRAIGGIGTGVLKNASIEVVQAAPSSSRATQPTPQPRAPQPAAQPTPQPRPPAPRPPSAAGPSVTVLPLPVNAGQQQQTSAAASGNSIVPPIDTTYPENFLALYSKLIYQIV